MPRKLKAKAAKALLKKETGERTPISHEQIKAMDYPGARMMGAFDEQEKTRSRGPEEAPIGEYASLDIPLWLAYYDDLVVTKEAMDKEKERLGRILYPGEILGGIYEDLDRLSMDPAAYLEEVSPLGFIPENLPAPTEERKKAATERLKRHDPNFGQWRGQTNPAMERRHITPSWMNMDIAKESFASEVDHVPFITPINRDPSSSKGHVAGGSWWGQRRLGEQRQRAKKSATIKAMTDEYPTERFPKK